MHESHITEVTMNAASLNNSPYQLICKYATRWAVTIINYPPNLAEKGVGCCTGMIVSIWKKLSITLKEKSE